MTATPRTPNVLLVLMLGACLAAALASCGGAARPGYLRGDDDDNGNASVGLSTSAPNDAVQAAFAETSYLPSSDATLTLRGSAPLVRVQIFRAGYGADKPMQGRAVSPVRTLTSPSRLVHIGFANWPSGLYYAKVTTPGRGIWDAPFVLRSAHLGTSRVAVVLPTNTWQAYNFEDGDSWYLNASVHVVDLQRPYVDAGVPPHYHGYDRGFIRWLALNGKTADFFSDDDLDRLGGDQLAHAYSLVVFSGHEEYVTEHELDTTERYRDLGGNLAFLSANDFFYKVVKNGREMTGRWRWRDLGRPEGAVVGSDYVDWNHDYYKNVPYDVTAAQEAPWLFHDTDLHDASTFGVYGIEVDAVGPGSPPNTKILAKISNIFGPGKSAEMTYYTTPRGAKVFSAGVMNFGGSALWPEVRTMMANLWRYLSVG
jgi:hypothetical protein